MFTSWLIYRIYKSQFKSVWSYILVSGESPRKAYPTMYRSQSLKALRHYEYTSNCQLLDVCNIVSNFCDINETSSVSVNSTVSVSIPLSTVAESSRCMTVDGPYLPTPVS